MVLEYKTESCFAYREKLMIFNLYFSSPFFFAFYHTFLSSALLHLSDE